MTKDKVSNWFLVAIYFYLVDFDVLLEGALAVEDVVAQLVGKVHHGHGFSHGATGHSTSNRCSHVDFRN